MSTLNKKIQISIFSGLIYFIVNLPETYKLTNKILNSYTDNNCPTLIGSILHTCIFFIITYLSMYKSTKDNGIKLKHTVYGTLIYYFVSSPALYNISHILFGNTISDNNGCPTLLGILLHDIIYIIILIGIMYLPEKNR
jgi:hypothetical protein